MKRSRNDTRIEIWSSDYINDVDASREDNDKNAIILQIEPGTSGREYIVEVVDPKDYRDNEEG